MQRGVCEAEPLNPSEKLVSYPSVSVEKKPQVCRAVLGAAKTSEPEMLSGPLPKNKSHAV